MKKILFLLLLPLSVFAQRETKTDTTYLINESGKWFSARRVVYINNEETFNKTLIGDTARLVQNQIERITAQAASMARDAQSSEVILRRTITGTSATELFLDGASVQAILPATNRIWTGTAKCSGSVTDVGNGATIVVGDTHARYQTFTVKRIGSSTTLMTAATGLTDTWTDTNMAGAAFTLTADNATEALKITFTPPTLAGSTTVCKAVCTVNVNELGF